MKFIDEIIENGITSNDVKMNEELKDNPFTPILIKSLEYYVRGELRKKKLNRIYERSIRSNFTT